MSTQHHRLLERQIRKYIGEAPQDAPPLIDFLYAVSDSYRHFERDRELLERSIELSSQEFTEANKELRRKNEALDGFVFRVAHDLKSPMNNVSAMLQMLKDSLDLSVQPPIVQKIMSNLELSAKNFSHRISDLLDITRQERSRGSVAEELCLESLVAEILRNLDGQIQNTGAEFDLNFEEFPKITYVRENMMSILGNLIENAIKYRDPNRVPRIKVQAFAENGHCRLIVSDNGLGMDLQTSGDRLFGLFNRLHSHVEGTGVGLYLVRKIVESKGGRIQVESSLGIGTTFQLFLRNDFTSIALDIAR